MKNKIKENIVWEEERKIRYQPMIKQYGILEDDEARPVEENVSSISIAYKDGKPTKAILTVNLDIGTILERCGPAIKTEEDPLRLVEIADFFNKK